MVFCIAIAAFAVCFSTAYSLLLQKKLAELSNHIDKVEDITMTGLAKLSSALADLADDEDDETAVKKAKQQLTQEYIDAVVNYSPYER